MVESEKFLDKDGLPDTSSVGVRLIRELKKKFLAIFIATMVGILTVFSDAIIENFKMAVSRVDKRIEIFETFSKDLSAYLFHAEVLHDGFSNKWIMKSGLTPIVKSYNIAIVKLRSNEYVNIGQIRAYWGVKYQANLISIYSKIKEFDKKVRDLNTEIGAVTSGNKESIDFSKTDKTTSEMTPLLFDLKNQSKLYLDIMARNL